MAKRIFFLPVLALLVLQTPGCAPHSEPQSQTVAISAADLDSRVSSLSLIEKVSMMFMVPVPDGLIPGDHGGLSDVSNLARLKRDVVDF